MQIEDGQGSGRRAGVDIDNRLKVRAFMQELYSHVSEDEGQTYSFTVTDAGPIAGEYPFYLKNDSDDLRLIVAKLTCSQVDADVQWILHEVSGVAAGASVVTGKNMNLGSGNEADATARGGAGGVSALTSEGALQSFNGGPAYSNVSPYLPGVLVLGKNDAIALEYQAGTGGEVSCTVVAYFHSRFV